MEERITIRLTSDEKNKLIALAGDKGFKSISDLARHLMEQGLAATSFRKADHFLLGNTTQSVLLLREILATISMDNNESSKTIENIKNEAANWVDKFSQSISAKR